MDLKLERYCLSNQDALRLSIATGENTQEFEIADLHIISAAVANPKLSGGISTTIKKNLQGLYELELPVTNLQEGYYEVSGFRLQSKAADAPSAKDVEWLPQSFEERCFFRISNVGGQEPAAQIKAEIKDKLDLIENQFLEPVYLEPSSKGEAIHSYTAFVFVRGVLVSTRIRFPSYEIVPFKNGLDSKDTLERVNDFLSTCTVTGLVFNYEDALRTNSRQSNPVCASS